MQPGPRPAAWALLVSFVTEGVDLPRVSIGMPVYNGEGTLRLALESLLAQSMVDFELLISDNASTDATASICQEFVLRDPRIRYQRQASNIGAAANFRYVLDQARGTYFMWAAADDQRSTDFLQHNLEFLLTHPGYVASGSPVRFEDGDFDAIRMGDASLDGSLDQRLRQFFRGWHANGRFYSLVQRAALLDCTAVDQHYLGSDWAVVLHLACQGKLQRIPQGWTVLGSKGASRRRDIFEIYRNHSLLWAVPFLQLTRFTWRCSRPLTVTSRMRLGMALIKLNAMAVVVQFLVRWR